ncbi:MAG: molybdopterin dinucleotide binding domain-containing protein [Euryarchaeota archaeon]|nr:molybdopterin dinucleotide binding domain-containing protein [Euryarchaeota archaeon]
MILLKSIMISGRTLGQGATCEAKMSPEFFKAVSVCSLSEEDYGSLGLAEGEGNVLVTTPFGHVVVSVRRDEGLPQGIIFIPMGPWANALVGPDTCGCGTPRFKGIEAQVEPTMAKVKDVRELFRGLGRAEP